MTDPASPDMESALEPFPSSYFEHLAVFLSISLEQNKYPSNFEMSLQDTRLYISRMDNVLSHLDDTLSTLQCTITKLKRAISPLRAMRQHAFEVANQMVQRDGGAGTKVNLPIEVLQLISSYAYPTLGRNRFAELKQDTTWGAIALPQARVWFQCYSFRGHGYERASTLLEDSAQAGTKIVAVINGQSVYNPGPQYIQLAVQHAARWVELSMMTSDHFTCAQLEKLVKGARELRMLRRLSVLSPHLTCPSIRWLFNKVTYLHVCFRPDEKETEYESSWVEALEGVMNLRTISLEFEAGSHIQVPPRPRRGWSQGTPRMVKLPHLRHISIKKTDLLDLRQLTFVIEDFRVECGEVESLEFYCLDGRIYSDEAQMEEDIKDLVKVINCKFPRLRSLAIAQPGIGCDYDRQEIVLDQCLIDDDIHGPLFPNLTQLTIFLDYTRRGFFSIYDFVLWRLSKPEVNNLHSVTLIGTVTKDDPLEFIGILQTLVPNVTIIKY